MTHNIWWWTDNPTGQEATKVSLTTLLRSFLTESQSLCEKFAFFCLYTWVLIDVYTQGNIRATSFVKKNVFHLVINFWQNWNVFFSHLAFPQWEWAFRPLEFDRLRFWLGNVMSFKANLFRIRFEICFEVRRFPQPKLRAVEFQRS